MITLVILACAFTQSGNQTCSDHVLPMPDATYLQCVTSLQHELAKWAGEHPGYEIKKFQCTRATGKA